MLHKSFKPAKCKTSLKLAMSRIKLMKNKKGVQINQMKRELAQLLQSGQDRTARIRVEHVIREEKIVAAYDLTEIYCELIAARLPVIESQKNCPIDLKEAITSVIFASPRCADLPELLDIRKHFTAKYGKEFITAAVELRPDCGVSRMLIEKLSAVAPDLQTKIKVLSAVAQEHNIKWDPKSFEETESKPHNDLLNGPNTFENAGEMHADPPKFQAPNVQAVQSYEQKHDEPSKFSQQNRRSSLGTQNFAPTDAGGIETSSAAPHTDVRLPGRGSETERMEVRQSFPRGGNEFLSGRQNWNMEFKDATSAAQAAAESAERASMAARAAAELSSRGNINSQYSTESQKSNIRDEEPQSYVTSKLPDERHSRDSSNSSFTDRKPKVQNQQTDRSEHDTFEKAAGRFDEDGHGGNKRSSRLASLRSSKDFIDDDKLVNTFQKADGYSQESSFLVKTEGPFSPRESKVEFASGQKDGFKSENFGYFGEVIRNQSSISSSRSHSSTSSDEFNVSTSDHRKFGNNVVADPFVGVNQGNIFRETTKTSSYVQDAAADDEADSDNGGLRFDMGPDYDEGEDTSFFPSQGSESLTHPSENTNIWSPRRNTSKAVEKSSSQTHFSSERHSFSVFSEYSEKSVDPSEPDNHVPVTFDGSDVPDSESEDELIKYSFSGTKDFSSFPDKRDFYSTNPEPKQVESHELVGSSFLEKGKSGWSDGATQLRSSSDDSNDMKMRPKNDWRTELDAESPKKFNSGKSRFELTDLLESESPLYNPVDEEKSMQSSRPSLKNEFKDNVRAPQSPDTLEDDEFLNQSNSESGKELNFGTLIGGLRHKGYTHPPYTKRPSGDASSLSKKPVEESSTTIEETPPPFVRSSFNTRVSRMENKKSSVPNSSSDSSSDDSSEKFPQQYSQKANKEVNKRSQFRPPVAFLNHDSDSEEDVPKQISISRVSLGTRLSRRTKAPPSSSYSKVRVESEAKTVNTTSDAGRKPSRHSSIDEIPPEPQSHSGRSRKEASKPMPESAISTCEESPKSQAVEQPFIPLRKTVGLASTETERKPGRHSYSNETPPEPRTHSGIFKQEVSKPMPESKILKRGESLKSQSMEQPSTPPRNTAESGGIETAKTSNLSWETSSGENTVKKPSHVHPKLPDYDSIAARLQSIRRNRQ